jgi:hypothetical protein
VGRSGNCLIIVSFTLGVVRSIPKRRKILKFLKIALGPSRIYSTVSIPVKLFPLNTDAYFSHSLLQSRPQIGQSRLCPVTPPSHVISRSRACLWLLAHLFILRLFLPYTAFFCHFPNAFIHFPSTHTSNIL